MKKNPLKYIYTMTGAITVFVFVIFLLVEYFFSLTNPSTTVKIIVFLAVSIFTGALITSGFSISHPIISEVMITLRRMLRLESLSNPILLKLSSEAPGTYHHSLNVSTLSQKAAKMVGADSLLVRTAAYYHDLGKLENPLLYVENQAGSEIPTKDDSASIRENAEEIISHVEKGVKIAEENHLPADMVDLIKEHHGTTRALYFYNAAKEKGLYIKKTDFRYDGPKPKTKESAILMLADCVEATARACPNLDKIQIEKIVDNTIEDRLSDGQFKNSGLTDLDLAKIKTSLTETLMSIYHQRIDYKKDNTDVSNQN